MSKIKQIVVEIQERLESGIEPKKIAEDLCVPLSWVTEAEMDMEWTWDPNNFIDNGVL